MKKKIVAVLMGALILANLNMTTFAADDTNGISVMRWDGTASVLGHLTVSGTKGNISVVVEGDADISKITATATLYYKSGSSWVKTSTKWNYSVNSDTLTIDEDFSAKSGTKYKVAVEANVYVGGSFETITREFTN